MSAEDRESGRDDLVPATALGRRGFLAASAGTLGALMAGCTPGQPEKLVPYVRRPPKVVPGVSDYYATCALRGGFAVGLLAESREGRPVKIEGHPEHPFSLGATGAREQAMVLSLYLTDRTAAPTERGEVRSWAAFERRFGPRSERAFVRRAGEGLFLWLAPSSSPVLAARLAALRERYPRARVFFDPVEAPVARWRATERVFGRALDVDVDLARADRVLFLDADALVEGPTALRRARQWARRRQPGDGMLRAYAFEPAITSTGVSADHRFAVRPSEVGAVAWALLARLAPELGLAPPADLPHRAAVEAVARDLAAHRGRSAVIVGDRQPAAVHVLGTLLDVALGNTGSVVRYRPSALLGAETDAFDATRLYDALGSGAVDTLITADANPAFTDPRFAAAAGGAAHLVALSRFRDETAEAADWVLPSLHPLERWGLHRAHDGTLTVAQPLLEPLVPGATAGSLIARLTGAPAAPRAAVEAALAEADAPPFEAVLARGLVEGAGPTWNVLVPDRDAAAEAVRAVAEAREAERGALELDLRPDVRVGHGDDAENAWLQELPEPNTQLVWDNAALLSEREMARRDLSDGDVVELSGGERAIRIPAFGVRGQADGTVVAWLGFGRRHGGRVARDVGVNVAPLRGLPRVRLRPTGERRDLVHVQHHDRLEHAEPILRWAPLAQWRRDPDLGPAWRDAPPPSLYPDRTDPPGAQWAMAIDLSRCTGCKACVVACQAENDVPVVGKTQVGLGRRMHWLRIDRYRLGRGDDQRVAFQPMLCQHCEKAPCEYVCPTNATVHSPDGLNTMIYNRCVGTRFCQNNCPYHVRRFNWLDYHRGRPPREQLVFNPDVTVRARGVMEKCTFCVQRIRRHERYGQGPLQTACQQACATEAIAFGDLRETDARVTRWSREPRAYAVLGELGTRPRVRYLARVDDVNPALRPPGRGRGHGEG
jgi:molybdopterin-containing oxidoreductase family iron-sulfur binding subunit